MWSLTRPARTARETYVACISRVRDPALKTRLEGVTQAIVDASAAFKAAAARQDLHRIARDVTVGGTVTRDEMEAVYTQRMAKKGSPGRDTYDELISAPSQGRCPLCGGRLVTTLDHHLPKALYPALAVAPLNLVPSCGDCNKAKLALVPRNAADVSLHPYFDHIDDERWLRADVDETRPAALVFRVEAPGGMWGDLMQRRVRNHFGTFGLAELYATLAAEELLNIRHQLTDLYATAGVDGVRSQLQDRALSCGQARRNGWRTAAYEAWSASEWFCNGGFAYPG